MNTRDTRRAIHREVAGKLVSRIVRIRASFRTVVEAAKLPRSRAPPPLPFPRILPFRRPLEKSNPMRLLIISFPERKGGERKTTKSLPSNDIHALTYQPTYQGSVPSSNRERSALISNTSLRLLNSVLYGKNWQFPSTPSYNDLKNGNENTSVAVQLMAASTTTTGLPE